MKWYLLKKRGHLEAGLIALGALLMLVGWPTAVQASNTPDLAIAPVYSAQQRAQNGIFDLKVTPGSQQTIELKVANLSKTEQDVRIIPTTAYTSDAGTLALDRSSVPTEPSLKVPFYDLVAKADREKTVTIPANTIEKVPFRLNIPKRPFKGVIVGGLHVTPVTDQNPLKRKGVSLKNKYAYSMAVVLKEDDVKAQAHLKLGKIKPQKVGTDIKVKSQIINDQPAVISDLTIASKITGKGKTKVLGHTQAKGLSMAPNSNFAFQNNWAPARILPGRYHLSMTAKSANGQEWHLEKDFQVNLVDAVVINDHYNPWMKYLIAAIVILLVLLGWYWIRKKKAQN